jgi:hypothetical protein
MWSKFYYSTPLCNVLYETEICIIKYAFHTFSKANELYTLFCIYVITCSNLGIFLLILYTIGTLSIMATTSATDEQDLREYTKYQI